MFDTSSPNANLPVQILLTEENQQNLEGIFKEIVNTVHNEEDPAQRAALVSSVAQFGIRLAQSQKVSNERILPLNFSFNKPSHTNDNESDDKDTDEDLKDVNYHNKRVDGEVGSEYQDENEGCGDGEDRDGDEDEDEEGDKDDTVRYKDLSGSEDNTAMAVQNRAAKKQDNKEVAKVPQLEPLKLALSLEDGLADMIAARNDFYNRLKGLKVTITKNRKAARVGFTEGEAVEITNIFFIEVMGVQPRQRVISLIRYYNNHEDEMADVGVGLRAKALATSKETAPIFRCFYRSFSNAFQTRQNQQSHYAHFIRRVRHLDLFNEWERLRELAREKDPALLEYLASQGSNTRRGVDYRSLVNRLIVKQLGLESVISLQNICQPAQALRGLVDEFGLGIIILLPLKAMNKLHRLGQQRMAEVYYILGQLVTSLHHLCKFIEQEIYQPMLAGEKLRIKDLKARRSLEETLQINDYIRDNEGAEDEVMAEGEDNAGTDDASVDDDADMDDDADVGGNAGIDDE